MMKSEVGEESKENRRRTKTRKKNRTRKGRIEDEDSKRKNRKRGFEEEESNTKKNRKNETGRKKKVIWGAETPEKQTKQENDGRDDALRAGTCAHTTAGYRSNHFTQSNLRELGGERLYFFFANKILSYKNKMNDRRHPILLRNLTQFKPMFLNPIRTLNRTTYRIAGSLGRPRNLGKLDTSQTFQKSIRSSISALLQSICLSLPCEFTDSLNPDMRFENESDYMTKLKCFLASGNGKHVTLPILGIIHISLFSYVIKLRK
ncbi:hypothetical protein YC2023_045051 [Brassica napus]